MRSSLPRAISALFLLILSGLAWGQLAINLPYEGSWEAWFGEGRPGADTNFKTEGKRLEIPTAGTTNSDVLSVFDPKSGNLAVKPFVDLPNPWTLSPKEFNRVAEVRVDVSHEGNPVAAANVILTSGKQVLRRLITPSGNGRATFSNVLPGRIVLTIETEKTGKKVEVPKQEFNLKLEREESVPILRVAIADPVDTVAGTTPSKSTSNPPAGARQPNPNDRGESPLTTFLTMVLAVVVVAGLAYMAIRLIPKHKDSINQQLAKVGVQIPEDTPTDEPADSAPAAVTPTRQPVQPIVLGSDAAAIPPASVSPTPLPRKRLVNLDSQETLELAEGTHMVSRDPGSALSLVGHASVSRRHAELRVQNGVWTVLDSGSTNGTFVNSVKVESEQTLVTGDMVQFGDVRFRVVEG